MCWEAYGACYKSTNNRQRCQAHLQRCLNSCIRSKTALTRRDVRPAPGYFANFFR